MAIQSLQFRNGSVSLGDVFVSSWGYEQTNTCFYQVIALGTVAKLAMRQPFVLFKGLTFQKLCL
ncbi:hypothetical protein ACTZM0_27155, partial [Klebsiella pneumoniae]